MATSLFNSVVVLAFSCDRLLVVLAKRDIAESVVEAKWFQTNGDHGGKGGRVPVNAKVDAMKFRPDDFSLQADQAVHKAKAEATEESPISLLEISEAQKQTWCCTRRNGCCPLDLDIDVDHFSVVANNVANKPKKFLLSDGEAKKLKAILATPTGKKSQTVKIKGPSNCHSLYDPTSIWGGAPEMLELCKRKRILQRFKDGRLMFQEDWTLTGKHARSTWTCSRSETSPCPVAAARSNEEDEEDVEVQEMVYDVDGQTYLVNPSDDSIYDEETFFEGGGPIGTWDFKNGKPNLDDEEKFDDV